MFKTILGLDISHFDKIFRAQGNYDSFSVPVKFIF
uniref:Uncharacterized protein n=1 Tax=Rhizophora mucronata TaxID=61149 RepID=A0A2P2NXJ9_RHIMU